MSDPVPQPAFSSRPDGARIAYHRTAGRCPGVLFLTGYASDMTGQKAVRIEAHCRARGQAFVRFDYQGHGASSGAFVDGTIGGWAEDAIFVLDRLTEGPQVLIGSSLGGWLMLLAARARPERVAGLIGIAAAPDFTEDMLAPALSPSEKETLARGDIVLLTNPYDPEPTPVTPRIIDDGRNHLVLRAPIPLSCPIRLIHGIEDIDVPWRTSLRLAERLASPDVEITLVKGGGHRLSEPADLDRLCRTLDRLLAHLGD